MSRSSLYQRLVAAGVEVANHYSDLYFPVNELTMEIVDEARIDGVYASKPKMFRHSQLGTLWFDAPFQFDPYWQARSAQ
jgi:hypothetical protein